MGMDPSYGPKVVQVIRTHAYRLRDGNDEICHRQVLQYWTLEGEPLWEVDSIGAEVEFRDWWKAQQPKPSGFVHPHAPLPEPPPGIREAFNAGYHSRNAR